MFAAMNALSPASDFWMRCLPAQLSSIQHQTGAGADIQGGPRPPTTRRPGGHRLTWD